MEAQILSAIQIAAGPTQDRNLMVQAVEFLGGLRSNPPPDIWKAALTLFLEQNLDGSRKHSQHTRVFALQLLDSFLDSRVEDLDVEMFQTLEQAFTSYIQSEYVLGPAEATAPFIRNKFSHTLALLFLCTYPTQWPNFFPVIFSLLRPAQSVSSTDLPPINAHVSVLFLRLLNEISGEVYDQTLKAARTFVQERHVRDARVRDEIRGRDSADMNTAVLTIVAEGEDRLAKWREQGQLGPSQQQERNNVEEVVELGIRAFASYVPWIDINLTVNQSTVPLLFRLLSDPTPSIREATSHAMLRIVQKGLKDPSDKLQLIRVLSLSDVLQALENKTRQARSERQANGRHEADELEEAYRESLGKLTNGLGLELVKLIEDPNASPEHRSLTEQQLGQLLPTALEFLGDEYDDTSSTLFPFFASVFSNYKKAKKLSPQTHLTDGKRQFLTSTLQTILRKMKWDKSTSDGDGLGDHDDFDDMDEDDKLSFETTRKELRSLMDAIIVIDEELVTTVVRTIALSTLSNFEHARNAGAAGSGGIAWQDAELAVHLVFLYGEIHKPPTKDRGKFSFVILPPELGSDKEKRKLANTADFPLTSHGEMMYALVKSGISNFPHSAVRSQYFEAIGRYGDFFKVRTDCIVPVLESLMDARGMHQPTKNRRGRLFYIFSRFIKDVRSEIALELIPPLLENIQDLLPLEVELSPASSDVETRSSSSGGSSPNPEQDANSILDDAVKSPGLFDNQLYLFETTGVLISLMVSDQDRQLAFLQAVTDPLLEDLMKTLRTPMTGSKDVLPVLRAHHLIQALGSIAKGFPDAPSPTPPDYIPPSRTQVFRKIAEAISLSLEVMNPFKVVREATRFAFIRIVASAGPYVAEYIPGLTSRLLSHFENAELVEFLSFLGLVLHRLGLEVADMVDQLILPLHHHITTVISQPIDGTDAKQSQIESKKAYLEFLIAIIGGNLHAIFISPRNAPNFEALLNVVAAIALDTTDPPCQKAAFSLLSKLVTCFGAGDLGTASATAEQVKAASNKPASKAPESHHVPGFDRFIYERLIPTAFEVPTLPGFNIKDGQSVSALGEIGVMLKSIHKARGQEALDYLANTFLPSKNSPPEVTADLVSKLRDLDSRGFKKYFTDFVRGSKQVT